MIEIILHGMRGKKSFPNETEIRLKLKLCSAVD